MRKIKIIFTFLLFMWAIGFPKSSDLNLVRADGYYSFYNLKISWNDERAVLYDFAMELEKDSNLVGYIAFYTNETERPHKLKFRVNRAKKFLISELKISKNRLVIVDAGKTPNESTIVLQPALKNFPPPNFGNKFPRGRATRN